MRDAALERAPQLPDASRYAFGLAFAPTWLMRARSPSQDEETLVYRRPANVPPLSGGLLFDQIMQSLASPPPRILHVHVPRPARVAKVAHAARVAQTVEAVPNVFETPLDPSDPPPPWAVTPAPSKRRRRLLLASFVLFAAASLGFGTSHSPARNALALQLRAAAHASWSFVHR